MFDVRTVFQFLEGDFEAAWNSLAAEESKEAYRGNFMFGRQAMAYLEVACRLCSTDPTGLAIQDFARQLSEQDSRYFLQLPRACYKTKDFALPSLATTPGRELIGVIYDLVRHGQAHQGQQITATLAADPGTDERVEFFIGLSGAQAGLFLDRSLRDGRPSDHLNAGTLPAGTVFVNVRTDILWHDLKAAVFGADLLNRGLDLKPLERSYPLSRVELGAAFAISG